MFDAIVVGARCAGSPTAMLLARAGYRVLLLEKARFPKDTISSHYIHQPGVACLDRWGLLDAVRATNCPPIDHVRYETLGVRLDGCSQPAEGHHVAYAPRRHLLDPILVNGARSAGVEYREGCTVTALLHEGDRVAGVRYRTQGHREITERSRLVVGADGMHSAVARLAGASTLVEHPRMTCTYYGYWNRLTTNLELYERSDRWIGVIPTNDQRTLVMAYFPQAEFHQVRADPAVHVLEAVRTTAPDLYERMTSAGQIEPLRGTGQQLNFFRQAIGGGWALVGDAVHHKDSIAARGMTDAFLQAESLVAHIGNDLTDRAALDVALGEYSRYVNEQFMAFYRSTLGVAELRTSESKTALLRTISADQAQVDRYFSTLSGVCRVDEFYNDKLVRAVGLSPSRNEHLAESATPTTLASAFETQVARAPGRTALVFDDSTMTYSDVNARANQLAHWLIERGAGPGSFVMVRVPRSFDLVTAIYAVVKSGAAYVPVETDLPEERVAFMRDVTSPVLTLSKDLPDVTKYPASNPIVRLKPDDAAYAIFTSGSSGQPKGVVVSHRSIMNRLAWGHDHFGTSQDHRTLLVTSASWDVSVPELFGPLQVGAALVIARPDGRRDPAYLARLIQRHQVTDIAFVPSLLRSFITEPAAGGCSSLRRIEVAGEVFPAELANRFADLLPDVKIYNLYGPTETTVEVTACLHQRGANALPIGTPIRNTQAYVLNDALQPVLPGVTGQLYIAGSALARGYIGQAALTAERFIANPYGPPGSRMYATGDAARWNMNGQLEYVGRFDGQLKVRGYRIEPAEIESVLVGHPAVREAVVVSREDRPGDQRLVAYVVRETNGARSVASSSELLGLLRRRLPSYMVPSAVVMLRDFPRTPAGKLDRRGLPAPDHAKESGGEAPRNHHEQVLCRLFAEVLGLDCVGVDDDFFHALGGHSLLAAQLSVRIGTELGTDIPVTTIFRSPTVAGLSAHLQVTAPSDDLVDPFSLVYQLRRNGDDPPLWLFPPAIGLGWTYRDFASHLEGRPVYAVQARGFLRTDEMVASVEDMVEDYVNRILAIQSSGPFCLAGWSYGGAIVHAVAESLDRRGHRPAFVAIVDCPSASVFAALPAFTKQEVRTMIEDYLGRSVDLREHHAFLDRTTEIMQNNLNLMRKYRSPVYQGDVLYVHGARNGDETWPQSWRTHILGRVERIDIDAEHLQMPTQEPAAEICAVFNDRLPAARP